MSLLTMIQDCAVKIGINRPSSVIGNNDTEALELLAFAQEEGKELVRRGDWQILQKENTFTSLAAEQQAALPSDFDHFVNETFWNRSRRIQFFGPLTPKEWQYIKSTTASVVTDTFRFRGNYILLNPVPAAGQTMVYEYISKNWCQDSSNVAQSSWAADTDTGILDERLMGLGIIVRYKMAKGLPYQEDLAKYETQVVSSLGFDVPKRTVTLSNTPEVSPNIGVPEGNWSL